MTIILSAPLTQNFAVGTALNETAKAATTSPEYTTGNNSALALASVKAPADIWVTKTLVPFTGYNTGDQIIYTIKYGNNGGQPANNVVINDTMNGQVSLPTTVFPL